MLRASRILIVGLVQLYLTLASNQAPRLVIAVVMSEVLKVTLMTGVLFAFVAGGELLVGKVLLGRRARGPGKELA